MDVYLVGLVTLIALVCFGQFAWKTRGQVRVVEVGTGRDRTITAKTKHFEIEIDVARETMRLKAPLSSIAEDAPMEFRRSGVAVLSMYAQFRSKDETKTRMTYDHRTDVDSTTIIIGPVVGTTTTTTHTSKEAGWATFKTGRSSFVLGVKHHVLDETFTPYVVFEGRSDDMRDLSAVFVELNNEFGKPQQQAAQRQIEAAKKLTDAAMDQKARAFIAEHGLGDADHVFVTGANGEFHEVVAVRRADGQGLVFSAYANHTLWQGALREVVLGPWSGLSPKQGNSNTRVLPDAWLTVTLPPKDNVAARTLTLFQRESVYARNAWHGTLNNFCRRA